jgi:hypothetical protein
LLTFGKRGEAAVHRYFDRDGTGWSRPSCGLVARIKPATLTLGIVKKIYSYCEPVIETPGKYIIIEIMNITSREIEINLDLSGTIIDPVVLSPCSYDYSETLSRGTIIWPVKIKPGEAWCMPMYVCLRKDCPGFGEKTRRNSLTFFSKQSGTGPILLFRNKPKELRICFNITFKKPQAKIRTNTITFQLKWE